MIISDEFMDMLIAELHLHNYIKMQSSSIFGNGPMNVVANDSQRKHIQRYIDDLFIESFLRNYQFKPVLFPKSVCKKRFTIDGLKKNEEDIILNLNNPYDRYTFVDSLSKFLHESAQKNSDFSNNAFICDLSIDEKNYGPIWSAFGLNFRDFCGEELETYLNNNYGYQHSKYKPKYRGEAIIHYSQQFLSNPYGNHYYEQFYVDSYPLRRIDERHRDFCKIKDSNIFGEYKFLDILLIFCLLVDKFEIKHDSLLEFVGLYAYDHYSKDSFLYGFVNFEDHNTDFNSLLPLAMKEDVFLRFSSVKESKTVTFESINDVVAQVRFFNNRPVTSICWANTLPLPYLYSENIPN